MRKRGFSIKTPKVRYLTATTEVPPEGPRFRRFFLGLGRTHPRRAKRRRRDSVPLCPGDMYRSRQCRERYMSPEPSVNGHSCMSRRGPEAMARWGREGKEGGEEEGALTVPDLSPMRIRPFLTFRPWVKGQERSDKRRQPSPGPSHPLGPSFPRGREVSL